MSDAVLKVRRRGLLLRKAALLLSLVLAPFWLLNAVSNFPWIVPADSNFGVAASGERTTRSGLFLCVASLILSMIAAAWRGRTAAIGMACAGSLWLASAFRSPLFDSPVRSVAWILTAVALFFVTFAGFRQSERPEDFGVPQAKNGLLKIPCSAEKS